MRFDELKEKTVFITGGNEGIGLQTAVLFAQSGANVAIMGRRAEKNEQAKSIIEQAGGKCLAIAADVTDEAKTADAIKQITDTYGGLHYGFNNAGIAAHPVPFTELSSEEFDRLININLKGAWLSMKYELPAIVASGGGAIVNTGSIASTLGLPMMPSYVASKHGLLGITRSAAVEYAPQGVRINMLCPGTTSGTGIYDDMKANSPQVEEMLLPQVPMARLADAEEMARAVVFLCSEGASYITGQALYADGGITVV